MGAASRLRFDTAPPAQPELPSVEDAHVGAVTFVRRSDGSPRATFVKLGRLVRAGTKIIPMSLMGHVASDDGDGGQHLRDATRRHA